MARPTLLDGLSDKQRTLVANMYYHNEPIETILKYMGMEDTVTSRQLIMKLGESLETPMTEALYIAYCDLAQIEYIMGIAAEAAEAKSPRHMSEYQKLGAHKIRLIKLIDDLNEKEEERGRVWEPSFDLNSIEYRIFKAAVTLALDKKPDESNDFDLLKPEDQARFFQILAESG